MAIKIYEAENLISLPCINQYVHPSGMGEIRYQILWKDALGRIQIDGPFFDLPEAEETLRYKLALEELA